MDVMLDIETLATSKDAVILTVGAVKFNAYSDEEPSQAFYEKIDIDEQAKMGRLIDDGTVAWWGRQSQQVQDEAFDPEGRISVEDFCKKLNKYLVNTDRLWAQGYGFDWDIIENLYRQAGYPVPWQFWQLRDSRTFLEIMPEDPRAKGADLHNALADAYDQAQAVQSTVKHFNIKKRA